MGMIEYKSKNPKASLKANHYVAWKCQKGGVWVRYDDDKVILSLPPENLRPYMVLYRQTTGLQYEDQIEMDKLIKDASVSRVEKKQKFYYHLLGTMDIDDNKKLYLQDAPQRRSQQKSKGKYYHEVPIPLQK